MQNNLAVLANTAWSELGTAQLQLVLDFVQLTQLCTLCLFQWHILQYSKLSWNVQTIMIHSKNEIKVKIYQLLIRNPWLSRQPNCYIFESLVVAWSRSSSQKLLFTCWIHILKKQQVSFVCFDSIIFFLLHSNSF